MKQIIQISIRIRLSKTVAHKSKLHDNKIAMLKIVFDENPKLFVTMWYEAYENRQIE